MRKPANRNFFAVITAMTLMVAMVPATAFATGGGTSSRIKLQNPKIAGAYPLGTVSTLEIIRRVMRPVSQRIRLSGGFFR